MHFIRLQPIAYINWISTNSVVVTKTLDIYNKHLRLGHTVLAGQHGRFLSTQKIPLFPQNVRGVRLTGILLSKMGQLVEIDTLHMFSTKTN